MEAIPGKRITYKRLKPNPKFEECLQRLYNEAKESNSKYEPVLKEAMASLAKYPLPLKSGSECAILKGFNKTICQLLDKLLVESATIENEENNSQNNQNDVINVENYVSPKKSLDDIQTVDSDAKQINIANPFKKGAYKPAFRTGGYAILMGLYEHSKRDLGTAIKKEDLIEIAQKYCEEPLSVAKSVRYSAWSNMTRLISKGLVKKGRSKKIEYALTDEGMILAKILWEENKNKTSINDVIFNKSFETSLIKNHDVDILKNCRSKSPEIVENEESSNVIFMPPNSFEIVLLIDKNENSGNSKKQDPYQVYPDLKYESRSLKVGDFTWIARHKSNRNELILPYIVERKRMDDLGSSIKDGRFHEQKFRLRKCGIQNVFYLVESYEKNKHVGLPLPSLMQALANTRIQDGFKVHYTDSLIKTCRFLAMMTKRLEVEYQNKSLRGRADEPKNGMLMTFEYFNKSSQKTKPLTVTEMFIKMLLQLKGMSVEKALAITNVYRTPKSLMKAYENCDEKCGAMLLASLKYGDLHRNVGPMVSKAVFHLFTFNR